MRRLSRPISVLHTIARFDETRGGPIVALQNLARAQLRAGLRVGVVTAWRRGDDEGPATLLRARGVDVTGIGPCVGKLLWHPSTGRIVCGAVAAADIVHIHGIWEDVHHHAARASLADGKPYVMRPCGMLDPWSLSRNYWLKRAFLALRVRADLNEADAIHYTSELERDAAAPVRLDAPALIEGNGIDPELFRDLPPRGRFRATVPFGDRPFILFFGRVTPKKGLDLIVDALAQPQCSEICLAVVGPDEQPFRSRLDGLITSAGLAHRVWFAGMLRGRAAVEALVDAELMVLPSRQENFATSVLESLAAGTPVIVSDQVDIHPDITREGVGAVVPLDAPAIAATIADWMRDADRRRASGERARAYALQHDWDRIGQRWAEHYAQLLAQPRHAPGRAGGRPWRAAL